MSEIAAVASNIGASVSQGRFQDTVHTTHLKDQEQSGAQVRVAAALQLIQSAINITVSDKATTHDLDLLA